MRKIWANTKIVQSWDRAVMAVGGLAVGAFMAVAVIWGDPTAPPIDMEALNEAELQMQCVPDHERSDLIPAPEHC